MHKALAFSLVLIFGLLPAHPEGTPADKYQRAMSLLVLNTDSSEQRQAVEILRSAAGDGYAPAQTAFATLLEGGALVNQDIQQALDWYKRAAQQGDWIAQLSLGRLYFAGNQIPRDTNAAQRWFEPAAQAGSSAAAFYMGLLHDENQNVNSDLAVARNWYRKAAELGNPYAQQRLAELLAKGLGGARDRQQAYMWLLVSIDLGNREAAPVLSSVESDLSKNERDAARQRAVELLSQLPRTGTPGCHGWQGEFTAAPLPPPLEQQAMCERHR
jgi:TPR repeat protein